MNLKTLFCFTTLSLSLMTAVSGQNKSSPASNISETKGSCSPIAPSNSGSITIKCSGFSDRQNKQIVMLLQQLSDQQAKDQDVLLTRMEEILATVKATQRLSSPRQITPEMQNNIVNHSAWGRCAREQVAVVAPRGDSEAQNFAIDFVHVLEQAGMSPRLIYGNLESKSGKSDIELLSTANGFDIHCTKRYIYDYIKGTFAIGFSEDPGTISTLPKADGYLIIHSR